MDLSRMVLEDDRRCTKEQLRDFLVGVHAEIVGSKDLRLKASMGLGRIVYIRCISGMMREVRLGKGCKRLETASAYGDIPYFSYKGQNIEIISIDEQPGVIVDPAYQYKP